MNAISNFLGDREYLVGYLTYADLELYFTLDSINVIEPTVIAPFANLLALHKRVSEIPAVAQYLKSDKNSAKTYFIKI